jgi:exopolyphosphatase/guanosine-5'-triphosphate,3'-diphosphate pyrophosphatase
MISQSSEPPFPHAAIDIGTNTLRLLIGGVNSGKLIRFAEERVITRLGRDLAINGVLNKDSIDNSIRTLKQFKVLVDKYKALNPIAVGTSALRDAGNSSEFIEAVKAQTGINVTIISGDKEAELTVQGMLGYINDVSVPAFIADIGGGSTEWILYEGTCNYTRSSLQTGAVRLNEQFIHSDPPAPEEIQNIKNEVIELVKQSFLRTGIRFKHDKDEIRSFIVTGGTATTVASIDMGLDTYDGERIHLHQISYDRLKDILHCLSSIPLFKRTNIKGLEPDRADIIIPGILILKVLMEMFKSETIIISDYGLLEGILLNPSIVTA